jgi:hypothetical protein
MGLNFVPVPTKFPLQDTIASVEELTRQLPKDDADDLRGRVCRNLRNARRPKDNMKKDHRKALKELRKGKAMVVMNKSDYDEKMRGMLDTAMYLQGAEEGPQESRIVRALSRLHNSGEITKCIYNRIRPTSSCPLRIYGLPKIHKSQTPLRPIVSCIDGPSYKLSKNIASVISPFAAKTSSHILNSKHIVGMMKDVHVEAKKTLISFDVTSLFTNASTDEAVDVIHRKLIEEEDLVERTPLPT